MNAREEMVDRFGYDVFQEVEDIVQREANDATFRDETIDSLIDFDGTSNGNQMSVLLEQSDAAAFEIAESEFFNHPEMKSEIEDNLNKAFDQSFNTRDDQKLSLSYTYEDGTLNLRADVQPAEEQDWTAGLSDPDMHL